MIICGALLNPNARLTSLQHIQINNQTAAREIVQHSYFDSIDPQEPYL